jgi:TM2 domain-containing membrane protein YozV
VAESAGEKSKVVAGILGIVLGGFGAHRFYLGDMTGGIIRLALSLCFGLGALVGLIEGIIYITKSDEDFKKIYVEGKKAWF